MCGGGRSTPCPQPLNILRYITGVYIKFEIYIFDPPTPFLINIFSPAEMYYNEWVRRAGEKLSAFFFAILYISFFFAILYI